jgi:hypothetical protein
MGTEWGGYRLHLLFESLLPSASPLWATLMSLTIFMGDAQFASSSAERTSVVRRSYFVCPMSPFLFGCRYFADVPSCYDAAKGSISFGAAHLRFCSAWFVTFLPLLLSLVSTKLL